CTQAIAAIGTPTVHLAVRRPQTCVSELDKDTEKETSSSASTVTVTASASRNRLGRASSDAMYAAVALAYRCLGQFISLANEVLRPPLRPGRLELLCLEEVGDRLLEDRRVGSQRTSDFFKPLTCLRPHLGEHALADRSELLGGAADALAA